MKIFLFGNGKMGQLIQKLVQDEKKHEVIFVADSKSTGEEVEAALHRADVAIDFTMAAAVPQTLDRCFHAGRPLIIGTTGWYEKLKEVKAECERRNGAIVYASNFSIGVNILFELNRRLAGLMNTRSEYEPQITEIHHLQKKDSPSGTAITLANDLLMHSPAKKHWVNHANAATDELIILSRREGEVKGIHEIRFTSPIDEIMIRHEAFSREGFARGALFAAEWLTGKKGFYEFRELITR
jgi:4-hydroxy-tetrahydrodipicolinate reductase